MTQTPTDDRPSERALVTVLDLVRSGQARTRPQIARLSGLGRALVTSQLERLLELGLLVEDGHAPSTGGRAPRSVSFRAGAGIVLVAALGSTSVSVGMTDLAGLPLDQEERYVDIAAGPKPTLDMVTMLFDTILKRNGAERQAAWGIALGLPCPVEFSTGKPVSPPSMPGWSGFPIRQYFADYYRAPVWVDNDANLLALGELRAGCAKGSQNLIYLKIGTGIGAGIVSQGQLHRGAQGCAGEIGHMTVSNNDSAVCRCGNRGCLEALASGFALARDGTAAAASQTSAYLASVLAERGAVLSADVTVGAGRGDSVCLELLQRSGRLVGEAVAGVVNFYNPPLIVVGGSVARGSDVFLAAIRERVYQRSLPLGSRDLRVLMSALGKEAALRGGAAVVLDELFEPSRVRQWLNRGSPAVMPDLVTV